MELREHTDKASWDAFLVSRPWASVTQSWDWGEFQATQGHVPKRFRLYDGDVVLLACQLVRHERGFIGYWFAPRGPVFSPEGMARKKEAFAALLEGLKGQLPGRTLFWRFEPMCSSEEARGLFPLAMQRRHFTDPSTTDVLDLAPTEDELLAAMHQKTRYNIRLAMKHGVTVREGTAEDIGSFLALTKETAARDGFLTHGGTYLKATFEELAPKGIVRLRLAEHAGKVLAANVETWFGDTATYLHGASSSQDRQFMAPFLLQWEAIRAAKHEGKRQYDFWGSNPSSQAAYDYKTSWEGLTRFKRGFSAREYQFAGTWDYPLHPWLYLLKYGVAWK
jgi:lipid II:glycine glycyltransferase (peptidoglycan interpeptide bridge formation enzyme)